MDNDDRAFAGAMILVGSISICIAVGMQFGTYVGFYTAAILCGIFALGIMKQGKSK